MLRIVIADDHAVVREGIKRILADMPDIVVFDECCNGCELLNKVGTCDYDIVLLDISMPGRNGLEVLKQLRHDKPKLPVLILSMFSEEQYAVRALKGGACGYLTKESAPAELIAAVRKVSQGGRYVSSSLSEKLAFELCVDSDKPLHETLSDREYQVVCMIASGMTVNCIADELALSNKTVSTYRTRILEKMRITNNAEITRYAFKHGLVE